jgi:phage-related protein
MAWKPDSWKPMKTIGKGVRELCVRLTKGAYRVVYLATLADAIYVLHAFEKKTQATPQKDIDLAIARFKTLRK